MTWQHTDINMINQYIYRSRLHSFMTHSLHAYILTRSSFHAPIHSSIHGRDTQNCSYIDLWHIQLTHTYPIIISCTLPIFHQYIVQIHTPLMVYGLDILDIFRNTRHIDLMALWAYITHSCLLAYTFDILLDLIPIDSRNFGITPCAWVPRHVQVWGLPGTCTKMYTYIKRNTALNRFTHIHAPQPRTHIYD